MEKVMPADHHSGVAIAGAAGPAMEMVKLFQLQLEHYEKVEGTALSLEGKANQLSQLIRANLNAALMGLAVVPLFAGYDNHRNRGRVFSYDVTGGRYEELDFQSQGSGSVHARNWIKAGWREAMPEDETVDLALRALFGAADEDVATGGPDLVRRIFPLVAVIDAQGYRQLSDDDVAARSEAVLFGPERGGYER
jgi:proteasome beta subunit